MKIYHEQSKVFYEVTEEKDAFRLVDSRTSKTYSFKESYAAIWFAIELIRQASFEAMTDEELKQLVQKAQVPAEKVSKNLILALRKEKINHTYYDQIFLKLLTSYRCGHEEVKVCNNTNFVVQHELAFMLRKTIGTKLTIPTVRV
jgi:hypothetical protein